MAINRWVSKSRRTQQVNTITPANVAIGNTFSVVMNSKTITFTATVGTVANVTAGLVALLNTAVGTDGEFAEITWADGTTAITATMNTAGTPFTQTSSASGGTATLVTATTTANSSPNDVNDANNWSLAAVPGAGDDVVIDAGDRNAGLWWNLGALSAVTLTSLTRRNSFTGSIGLPEYNTNGIPYFEYRATELAISATTITIEQAQGDQAASIKINVGSVLTTATIRGQGFGTLGSEATWLRGTNASNVFNVEQGSLAVGVAGGVSATILTLNAEQSVVRMGSGLTGPTTINAQASTVEANATFTTLNATLGSTVTAKGAAAVTTLNLDSSSTVVWKSSGTITTAVVGNGCTLDFSTDNRARTITNKVSMYAGSTFNDPAGTTIAGGLSIQTVRCSTSPTDPLGFVQITVGPNHSFAITA